MNQKLKNLLLIGLVILAIIGPRLAFSTSGPPDDGRWGHGWAWSSGGATNPTIQSSGSGDAPLPAAANSSSGMAHYTHGKYSGTAPYEHFNSSSGDAVFTVPPVATASSGGSTQAARPRTSSFRSGTPPPPSSSGGLFSYPDEASFEKPPQSGSASYQLPASGYSGGAFSYHHPAGPSSGGWIPSFSSGGVYGFGGSAGGR